MPIVIFDHYQLRTRKAIYSQLSDVDQLGLHYENLKFWALAAVICEV